MSDQQRDAAADLAVCAAATPGPWSNECGEVFDMLPDLSSTFSLLAYSRSGDRQQERAILAFVALAREALPWWIEEARLRQSIIDGYAQALDDQQDEIERLMAENARLKQTIANMEDDL